MLFLLFSTLETRCLFHHCQHAIIYNVRLLLCHSARYIEPVNTPLIHLHIGTTVEASLVVDTLTVVLTAFRPGGALLIPPAVVHAATYTPSTTKDFVSGTLAHLQVHMICSKRTLIFIFYFINIIIIIIIKNPLNILRRRHFE